MYISTYYFNDKCERCHHGLLVKSAFAKDLATALAAFEEGLATARQPRTQAELKRDHEHAIAHHADGCQCVDCLWRPE